MKISYREVLLEQFSEHQQRVLLSGPRQVGKTTLAQSLEPSSDTHYFNYRLHPLSVGELLGNSGAGRSDGELIAAPQFTADDLIAMFELTVQIESLG